MFKRESLLKTLDNVERTLGILERLFFFGQLQYANAREVKRALLEITVRSGRLSHTPVCPVLVIRVIWPTNAKAKIWVVVQED